MSKDIKIEKVGVPQEFDGVSKIVTSSPDFFQATWIPEEETLLIGKLKIHRNGHYDADNFMVPVVSDGVETEKQIYGFSEITVDVPIKPPIITGDIDIDIPPIDIDIPPIDIDIPPIDIDIPPIDIDIPPIDIDIPPIDIVIPPIDIEIPEFPTDIIDITHIDDNGNIIAITRQDLEDMDLTIEDIDGMIDPVLTIDDFGNIDIVDAFDTDLSGLEVVDLAIGDIDLKVDGLDDDGRTKFIDEYLPTSIELTVPPNKLVYHDGEPIDLTGAVVSAKYKGGTAVWANEKYRNGIIPLGELRIEPNKASGKGGRTHINKNCYPFPQDIELTNSPVIAHKIEYGIGRDITYKLTSSDAAYVFAGLYQAETNEVSYCFFCSKEPFTLTLDITGAIEDHASLRVGHRIDEYGRDWYTAGYHLCSAYYPYEEKIEYANGMNSLANRNQDDIFWAANVIYEQLLFGDESGESDTNNDISLSWPRPKDSKILSTAFEIDIMNSDRDNNGSN